MYDTSSANALGDHVKGVRCSAVVDTAGVEKGISKLSISIPCITPLLIITAEEETKAKKEGERRLLHNMLSIKSTEAEWVLGG